MSLLASFLLPLVMVAGTAYICYIVMQARSEVAVSREREKLTVALATHRNNELLLEEKLKSAENLAYRQCIEQLGMPPGYEPMVEAGPSGMISDAGQMWQDPPSEPMRIPISRITVVSEPVVRGVIMTTRNNQGHPLSLPWPRYTSQAMLRSRPASPLMLLGPPSAKSAWICAAPNPEVKVTPYRRRSSGLR